MNNPELYEKYSHFSDEHTRMVLEKYFHLIRRSSNKKKAALDIGCGPGNITHHILSEYLEQDVKEIIGIDIVPKMINYANKTYNNEKIHFRLVNVAENVPDDFVEHFDYIFSFWALHWMSDQRTLYSNILKMLKPKGDMFVMYIANTKLYEVYKAVWRKEKYAPYISNFFAAHSPFCHSEKPVEELLEILKEAGFKDVFCKIETVSIPNTTEQEIEEYLMSINPYYASIPKELQKDFVSDHVELVDTRDVPEGEAKYYVEFDLFVAHGRKNQ